jgi:hypothetical protein
MTGRTHTELALRALLKLADGNTGHDINDSIAVNDCKSIAEVRGQIAEVRGQIADLKGLYCKRQRATGRSYLWNLTSDLCIT